jgi:RNA polymerase sigma factor (sigma-70 family)
VTDWQTEEFERHRPHLRAVAYRMLGSMSDADDVLQETWLRLNRSDADSVENMRAWLTTIVARLALDELRARQARREESARPSLPEPIFTTDDDGPEREAVMADSVGFALLVVLDTLTPPERLAFVLHDMFALPFEEISPIVGRSPVATRQLASRARRRIQRAAPEPEADLAEQRVVVDAFLTAARQGDFDALLEVLDPDVVLRMDRGAHPAAEREPAVLRGAEQVAGYVLTRGRGFARYCRPAIVNGSVGLVVMPGPRPVGVVGLTVANGRIVEADLVADKRKIRAPGST